MDNRLLQVIRVLDALTEKLGRLIAWLSLAMVLGMVTVVVMRYLFNHSSIPLQESVMYLHAMLFMLGSGYALKHNDHVRVDIFYQGFSTTTKALVDLFGALFLLLPVLGFIGVFSFNYVSSSWKIHEVSQEADGLAFVYLLKSLILLMPLTLGLQGLAEAARSLATILGIPNAEDKDLEVHS